MILLGFVVGSGLVRAKGFHQTQGAYLVSAFGTSTPRHRGNFASLKMVAFNDEFQPISYQNNLFDGAKSKAMNGS